jgi:hypothetical protein
MTVSGYSGSFSIVTTDLSNPNAELFITNGAGSGSIVLALNSGTLDDYIVKGSLWINNRDSNGIALNFIEGDTNTQNASNALYVNKFTINIVGLEDFYFIGTHFIDNRYYIANRSFVATFPADGVNIKTPNSRDWTVFLFTAFDPANPTSIRYTQPALTSFINKYNYKRTRVTVWTPFSQFGEGTESGGGSGGTATDPLAVHQNGDNVPTIRIAADDNTNVPYIKLEEGNIVLTASATRSYSAMFLASAGAPPTDYPLFGYQVGQNVTNMNNAYPNANTIPDSLIVPLGVSDRRYARRDGVLNATAHTGIYTLGSVAPVGNGGVQFLDSNSAPCLPNQSPTVLRISKRAADGTLDLRLPRFVSTMNMIVRKRQGDTISNDAITFFTLTSNPVDNTTYWQWSMNPLTVTMAGSVWSIGDSMVVETYIPSFLTGLADVKSTMLPNTDDLLQYDGTEWKNSSTSSLPYVIKGAGGNADNPLIVKGNGKTELIGTDGLQIKTGDGQLDIFTPDRTSFTSNNININTGTASVGATGSGNIQIITGECTQGGYDAGFIYLGTGSIVDCDAPVGELGDIELRCGRILGTTAGDFQGANVVLQSSLGKGTGVDGKIQLITHDSNTGFEFTKSVARTTISGYEANVLANNDIPNKKYVDDAVGGATTNVVYSDGSNTGNVNIGSASNDVRISGNATNLFQFYNDGGDATIQSLTTSTNIYGGLGGILYIGSPAAGTLTFGAGTTGSAKMQFTGADGVASLTYNKSLITAAAHVVNKDYVDTAITGIVIPNLLPANNTWTGTNSYTYSGAGVPFNVNVQSTNSVGVSIIGKTTINTFQNSVYIGESNYNSFIRMNGYGWMEAVAPLLQFGSSLVTSNVYFVNSQAKFYLSGPNVEFSSPNFYVKDYAGNTKAFLNNNTNNAEFNYPTFRLTGIPVAYPNQIVSIDPSTKALSYGNPSFLDSVFELRNAINQTRIVRFTANNLTNGATRTTEMPDRSGVNVIANIDMPISLTTPGSGDLMQYNGTNWVNIIPGIAYANWNDNATSSGGTLNQVNWIQGTFGTSLSTNFTLTANNTFTYTGSQTANFEISYTATAAVASNDRTIQFTAWKNPSAVTNPVGSYIAGSRSTSILRTSISDTDTVSATTFVSLATNDVVRFYCSNVENNDSVTVVDFSIKISRII